MNPITSPPGANACVECGQNHGQVWAAAVRTEEEFRLLCDELWHPWKYADRPKVAWSWHLFPRSRRLADAVHEVRWRIESAWAALRHGEEAELR